MSIRKMMAVLILIGGFLGLWAVNDLGPVFRLGYASIGLIGLIKLSALLFEKHKFESKLGLLCFLFLWPGVSSSGFRVRLKKPPEDTGNRFLEHWLTFILGTIILVLSLYFGRGRNLYLNYLSLFSILLIVHMGLVEVVRDLLKLIGFNPNMMFDRPYAATSLKDFWSFRWNRAFVEMNKIFFVTPLKGKFGGSVLVFLIFVISGVLHEVGISYSSGQDFGRPLIYFFIQGIGFILEGKFKLRRLGTILFVVLPFPLLFPPSFVNTFFGIFAEALLPFIEDLSQKQFFSGILLVGGILQSMVLLASFQVPSKLDWKNDLAKLSPFNRKVFWTYGGYILSTIIFMAVVSILISFEESIGFGARVWLIFILLFWLARVLIDFFYYSHEDWPKGAEFVIGHICLTTLFLTLVFFYALALYLSFSMR
jgi:hypothetical protein